MSTTLYFDIADFRLRLVVPEGFPLSRLSKAYAPFLLSNIDAASSSDDLLLTLEVTENAMPYRADTLKPLTTGINDLGEARLFIEGSDYLVGLSPMPGCGFRFMKMSADFTYGILSLSPGDRFATFTVDSMLRILFSQALVGRDSFLLHASAVVAGQQALLFMGKSGTGKSTHASLWQSAFPDVSLLNDDNPVVRVMPDGSVRTYGSPWSGKTPCYRNASAPVAAFVRLRQAPDNSFRPLSDIDAFVAILPGVSVITHSRALYDRVCSTVISAASAVTVGMLDCRPDTGAAILCRRCALGR